MNRHALLILAGLLTLLSCGRDKGQDTAEIRPMAVVLFSPYGMQDMIREQKMCEGFMSAVGSEDIRSLLLAPLYDNAVGIDMLKTAMNRLKDDPAPHLFIIAGSGYRQDQISDVIASMEGHDHDRLLIIGPAAENDTLDRVEVCSYGAAYMAGVLAARMFPAEDAVIGGCYDPRDRSLQETGDGFCDGMDSRKPGGAGLWNVTQSAMQDMYFSKVDNMGVLFEYNEVYDFAVFAFKPWLRTLVSCPESVRSYYVLGIDADLSIYSPNIPFSCVRHMDRLIEDCIRQWLSDEGLPHEQWYGLDSEYVTLTLSPAFGHLQAAADSVFSEAVRMEREYVSRRTSLPQPYEGY